MVQFAPSNLGKESHHDGAAIQSRRGWRSARRARPMSDDSTYAEDRRASRPDSILRGFRAGMSDRKIFAFARAIVEAEEPSLNRTRTLARLARQERQLDQAKAATLPPAGSACRVSGPYAPSLSAALAEGRFKKPFDPAKRRTRPPAAQARQHMPQLAVARAERMAARAQGPEAERAYLLARKRKHNAAWLLRRKAAGIARAQARAGTAPQQATDGPLR